MVVAVGVLVLVLVIEALGVTVGVAEVVGESVGVPVTVGVSVGVGESVGLDVAVSVGVPTTGGDESIKLSIKVTSVCPRAFPCNTALSSNAIVCEPRIVPANSEFAKRVVVPATAQKTLLATAPPAIVTLIPVAILRSWAISKIKTSVALPERITSALMFTTVVQL